MCILCLPCGASGSPACWNRNPGDKNLLQTAPCVAIQRALLPQHFRVHGSNGLDGVVPPPSAQNPGASVQAVRPSNLARAHSAQCVATPHLHRNTRQYHGCGSRAPERATRPAHRHQNAAIAESQLGIPACFHALRGQSEQRREKAGQSSQAFGNHLSMRRVVWTWMALILRNSAAAQCRVPLVQEIAWDTLICKMRSFARVLPSVYQTTLWPWKVFHAVATVFSKSCRNMPWGWTCAPKS